MCFSMARKDFPGNTVAYYFSDQLKTASVITDSAGAIKAESEYYPWGGELQFVNNDSNDYKFTGKKRDLETGLDYFGARYYSNGLGRWVSADWSATPVPVAYADFHDPQSLNLYGYVRNVPTTGMDPDGHECTAPTNQCAAYSWLAGKIDEGIDAAADFVKFAVTQYQPHAGAFPRPQPCICPEPQKQDNKQNNNNSKSQNTNGEKSGSSSKNGTAPKEGETGGPGAGKCINDTTKGQALSENKAAARRVGTNSAIRARKQNRHILCGDRLALWHKFQVCQNP